MENESIDLSAILNLKDAISNTTFVPEENKSYTAQVVGNDNDGTIWVHILGGVARTPAVSTTVNVRVDDYVTVRIENGECKITGNITSTAITEADAEQVFTIANNAQTILEELEAVKGSDYTQMKQDVARLRNTINSSLNEVKNSLAVTDAHFYYDDQGAHVVHDAEGTDGAHLLANMLGILFMVSDYVNLSMTRDSINFYNDSSTLEKDEKGNVVLDDDGNPKGLVPIASYSKDGIIIGDTNSYHIAIVESGIEIIGEDGKTVSAYLTGTSFQVGTPQGQMVDQYGISSSLDESTIKWNDYSVPDDYVEGMILWQRTAYYNAAGEFLRYSPTVRLTGMDGNPGTDGGAIKDIVVKYCVTTSSTHPATSSSLWKSDPQKTTAEGQYLWVWTRYIYETEDGETTTDSFASTAHGSKGDKGNSFSGVQVKYLVTTSSSQPSTSLSSWSTTPTKTTASGQYLWIWTRYTYETDTGTTYKDSFTCVPHGEKGDSIAGSPGRDGNMIMCYVNTSAAGTIKVAYTETNSPVTSGTMYVGLTVAVRFTDGNIAPSWTFRLANFQTTAYNVWYNNAIISNTNQLRLSTNQTVQLVWDGARWRVTDALSNYITQDASGLRIGYGNIDYGYMLLTASSMAFYSKNGVKYSEYGDNGMAVFDNVGNQIAYLGYITGSTNQSNLVLGYNSSAHVAISNSLVRFYANATSGPFAIQSYNGGGGKIDFNYGNTNYIYLRGITNYSWTEINQDGASTTRTGNAMEQTVHYGNWGADVSIAANASASYVELDATKSGTVQSYIRLHGNGYIDIYGKGYRSKNTDLVKLSSTSAWSVSSTQAYRFGPFAFYRIHITRTNKWTKDTSYEPGSIKDDTFIPKVNTPLVADWTYGQARMYIDTSGGIHVKAIGEDIPAGKAITGSGCGWIGFE